MSAMGRKLTFDPVQLRQRDARPVRYLLGCSALAGNVWQLCGVGEQETITRAA